MNKLDSIRLPLGHEKVPVPDIFLDGQPAYVLNKGSSKKGGMDFLHENILVARIMLEFAKDFFGPERKAKMITVQEGNSEITYITTDLMIALSKVKFIHPFAQIIAGAGISVVREYGGGGAYCMVIAGKTMEETEKLLKLGVHPMVIVDGLEHVLKEIRTTADSFALKRTLTEKEIVEQHIETSLKDKMSTYDSAVAVRILREIVRILGIETIQNFDVKDIASFRKMAGNSLDQSEVIDGMAFYKEIPNINSPRRIENAKIAVVRGELRIPKRALERNRNLTVKYEFNKTEEMREYRNREIGLLKDMVKKIVETGANVVVVEEGIAPVLLEYFSKLGILALMRFPYVELFRVAKATGANLITDYRNASTSDCGTAKLVEAEKIGSQPWIFMRGCSHPKTVDVLLRGVNDYLLDDVETVLKRQLTLLKSLRNNVNLVVGGGSFEIDMAKLLRRSAYSFSDERQLVFDAFAEVLEYIPCVLAENAGLNQIDTLTELKARHAKGEVSTGIDASTRKIEDMEKLGIFDSLAIKIQAITTAFEVAVTALRIDECFISRELSEPERNYVKRMKGMSPERLKTMKKEHGLETIQ